MAATPEAVDRYAGILRKMADASVRALLSAWDQLPSKSIARQDDWRDVAEAIIEAFAQASVDATVAMMAELGVEAAASDLIVPDAVARVLDPYDRMASVLKGGQLTGIASSGRDVVEQMGHDTVLRTARQSVASIAGAERGPWVRRVTARSCEWCLRMSTYTYDTAESASFGHERCDCVPMPWDLVQDHNDSVLTDRGLTPADLEAKNYERQHRSKLRKSRDTAKRREAEIAAELRTETDPARRRRIERRRADWSVRADRAQERLDLLS